jgi:REP-associated tyrosine transposase
MTPRLRDAAPGVHHVVVGATGPSPYFIDEIDRLDWVRRFVRMLDRFEWTCIAFCLMTTHVHAVLDIPDESLPLGMHALNMPYGKRFNVRHDRVGNLLRARYWSTRLKDDDQLLAAFRYTARNPSRAGMCPSPESWRWSSFATSCGLTQTFPFVDATRVLSLLGSPPVLPAQALLPLVRD